MTAIDTESTGLMPQVPAAQAARHAKSQRPGWVSRSARRDPLRAVAFALIAVQLMWRADIASRGFLAADDYILVRRALGADLDSHYLMSIWNDHLMPGGMFIYWVVTKTTGYSYWPYVLIMLLGQAVLSIALYRLLRRLFGSRWAILLPLCLVIFSPLTLETTTWWAVGVTAIPMEIAIVFAVGAQIRYIQTRQARHLLTLGLSLVFGLIFFEKTLLVAPLLFLLTACFFVEGGPIRSTVRTLVRYWPAWLVVGGLSAGYSYLYLMSTEPSPPLPSTIRGGVDFLQYFVLHNFVPGLIGGPWHWLPNGDSPPFTATESVPRLAALAILIAFIGVTAWRRPLATRAWIALGLYLALVAGLLVSARAGFSPLAGLLTRYLSDVVVVAAICVGVAMLGLRGAADHGPERSWPLPNLLREPGAAAVGMAMSLVAVAALGIGAAWSAQQYGDAWASKSGRDYLTNIRADVAAMPSDTVFFDQPVPPEVMSPIAYPENMQSTFLGHIIPTSRFVTEAVKISTIDASGHIHRGKVSGVSTQPGPEPGCGYRLSGSATLSMPLAAPVFDWQWALRVGYIASDPTTVSLRFGQAEHTFAVEKGLQEIFFLLDKSGGSQVDITIADPTVTICFDQVEVGILAPADR